MTDCKQAKLCHLIFIVVVKLLAVAQGQTFNYQNFSQSWDCPRDGIIRGNFPHQPRLNLGAFIAHPRFWTTLIPTSRSGQDIAAFRLVREWPESTQPLSFRVTPTQHGEPGRIIVHLAMNDINPMSSAEGGFLYENSQNDVKQFFPYKVLHFEKGMGGRDYHPSLDGGPNYEPAYQLIRRGLFNCFIQRYAHINLNDDESYERGSTDCSAGRKNPICCYTAFPKKEYEAIMEEMKATGERSYDWPKKMENNMFDERGEEYQCTKGCTETCYPLHCKIAKFYIGNQGDWKNERPGDELCSQVAEKYAEYENDVGKNQLEGSERFREDSLKHKDDVGADPTTFRSPFNKRVIETLQTCKIKSKAYEEAKQMFKDKKLLWETLRNPDTWREYEFNGIPESVREMDSKDWDQQWTEMRHDNLLVREQLKTPWHKSRHHVPDPGDDPIPEIRPCRASCYDGMIIQVEFIPIRMHEDFRSSKMRISLIGRRWMHFDQSMRTGGVDLMQYIKDQRGMYFGDFDKGEYNNRIDYDSIEIKYMPGEDGKIPVLVKGQEKGIWMKWLLRTQEKKEGPILQIGEEGNKKVLVQFDFSKENFPHDRADRIGWRFGWLGVEMQKPRLARTFRPQAWSLNAVAGQNIKYKAGYLNCNDDHSLRNDTFKSPYDYIVETPNDWIYVVIGTSIVVGVALFALCIYCVMFRKKRNRVVLSDGRVQSLQSFDRDIDLDLILKKGAKKTPRSS